MQIGMQRVMTPYGMFIHDRRRNNYSLNGIVFQKLSANNNDVYTNGHFFLKVPKHPEQLAGLQREQQIYTELGYDHYVVDNMFISKSLGKGIPGDKITQENLLGILESLQEFYEVGRKSPIIPPANDSKALIDWELSLIEDAGLREVATKVCKTLSYRDIPTQGKKRIHGDLTPHNVVFNSEGKAFLLDFEHSTYGTEEWDLASLWFSFKTIGQDQHLQILEDFAKSYDLFVRCVKIRLAISISWNAAFYSPEKAISYINMVDEISRL